MHVVAFVAHKPGRVEAGSQIQGAFIDYLRNHPDHPDGVVHNGGPTLSDDSETIVGLLLIAEAPSLDAARAFLADSPYGKADIFADVQLRPWEWRTGRPGCRRTESATDARSREPSSDSDRERRIAAASERSPKARPAPVSTSPDTDLGSTAQACRHPRGPDRPRLHANDKRVRSQPLAGGRFPGRSSAMTVRAAAIALAICLFAEFSVVSGPALAADGKLCFGA